MVDNVARGAALAGLAFPLLLIVVSQKLGQTSFLGFSFLGITAIQLSLRPTLRELLLTTAAGCAYFVTYIFLGGSFSSDPIFCTVGILAFLGAGSLLAMVARLLWAGDPEQQRRRLHGLMVGITPILFLAYTPLVFRLISIATPFSFDRYLYAFDARFGFEPGFAAGALFASCPLLQSACALVYLGLPLAMAGVYIAASEVADEPGLVRTFLLTGLVGALLFHIVPAAGPVYAFTAGYPAHPPAVVPGFVTPVHLNGVRLNAIPSLHTAWALLIFWRARCNGIVVRAAASVFLFLTLLATLGLGEHYLIDLVVAVPYVVAMRALWMTKAHFSLARIAAFGCSAVMVAIWLMLLRRGALLQIHPMSAWCLSLFTVGLAVFLDSGVRRYRFRSARKRLGEPVFAATGFAQRAYPYQRRRGISASF